MKKSLFALLGFAVLLAVAVIVPLLSGIDSIPHAHADGPYNYSCPSTSTKISADGVHAVVHVPNCQIKIVADQFSTAATGGHICTKMRNTGANNDVPGTNPDINAEPGPNDPNPVPGTGPSLIDVGDNAFWVGISLGNDGKISFSPPQLRGNGFKTLGFDGACGLLAKPFQDFSDAILNKADTCPNSDLAYDIDLTEYQGSNKTYVNQQSHNLRCDDQKSSSVPSDDGASVTIQASLLTDSLPATTAQNSDQNTTAQNSDQNTVAQNPDQNSSTPVDQNSDQIPSTDQQNG